jgi:hypothetical protein
MTAKRTRSQTVKEIVLRPGLQQKHRETRVSGLFMFLIGGGVAAFIIWAGDYDDWIGKGLIALGVIVALLGFLTLIQGNPGYDDDCDNDI